MNKHDKKEKEKQEEKHQIKLDKLINEKKIKDTNKTPPNIDTPNVVNNSDVILTEDQLKVLSKGLKFALTPRSINIVDLITNTENSLNNVPNVTKQLVVSEISTFIKLWKKPKNTNIDVKERKALKELKNMENIVITQADKGGKDKNIYEEVANPTNLIKTKISTLADRLLNLKRINTNMKNEFLSIEDLPKIRGQPKLHKKEQPMRLITSTRNTILSTLSKFAFSFIKQLRETLKHTICNTSKFIKEISNIKIEENDNLISTIDIRWYRKETASDRLLDYNSHHNKAVKINIINNMTSRIIERTKNKIQQQEDLNKLKEILVKSNYPTYIINKCMKNTIQLINTKINGQRETNNTNNNINNSNNNINNNNNNINNNNNNINNVDNNKNNNKIDQNNNNKMKYHITLPFSDEDKHRLSKRH
ncbi:unnamed protein product [Rotaria sordida]|uniref:Helix-turn-helix domain-containing protein n=1 Tax=Rotaria sordida TaxID=392033 RepID=A0A815PX39_9BILA|nr:unnamed protein product [Rotaria sordida]